MCIALLSNNISFPAEQCYTWHRAETSPDLSKDRTSPGFALIILCISEKVIMESLVQKAERGDNNSHLPEMRDKIQRVLHMLYGLSILNNVVRGSEAHAMLDLLQKLADPNAAPEALALSYSHAFAQLAALANNETTPRLADAWQACLAMRLIDDCNSWSSQVERFGTARVSPGLRTQARRELRVLQSLFAFDAQTLWQSVRTLVASTLPELQNAWIPWLQLAPGGSEEEIGTARARLAIRLATASDWGELLEDLEQYWARHGTGPLAQYSVLRWLGSTKQLAGIAHPDPVRLTSLVAQERQQERLTTNIKRFLAGLPSQDMLLYGPPGTGKSSTIKALVNTYAEAGLCLVEVNKDDIGDLALIVAQLRQRSPRYLLFIDDLSFEEHETAYKALKVLLEGTAESRPANVLICATSNRLNLIRENFSERGKPTEDVTWRDTMDEKQSLAHRFALRVTFFSPDQRQYLYIVEQMARQRGLELPEAALQERALQWERQHTGRSGRLARQFIDDLEAELKYR